MLGEHPTPDHHNKMAETAAYFRGHAKISLRNLKFHSPLFASRAFDISHVERLKHIFMQESCARSEPCNFISAVIENDILEQVIAQSETTYESLRSEIEIPQLSLPDDYKLRCLYGKHRVKAAEDVFILDDDHWWPVTLYHDSKCSKNPTLFLTKQTGGIPVHLQRQLCVHRDDEFRSGDIFRNLRHCELTGNSELAFWESKLSQRSQQDLVALKRKYDTVLNALDNLLPFPGLWEPFNFFFLRRLTEISCPNVSARGS